MTVVLGAAYSSRANTSCPGRPGTTPPLCKRGTLVLITAPNASRNLPPDRSTSVDNARPARYA